MKKMKNTWKILKIIIWYFRWFLMYIGIAGIGFTYDERKKIQKYSSQILLLSALTKLSMWQLQSLIDLHPRILEIIFEGIDTSKKVSEEELLKIKTRIFQLNFL